MWDLSSAGRASALQAEGHRFEPYRSHMDGFPSGQRGQTVNLLAMPSKVRILLHPLYSKLPGIFAWEFCCHTPKRFESFSIHYILNSQVKIPGSFLYGFSLFKMSTQRVGILNYNPPASRNIINLRKNGKESVRRFLSLC